MLELLLVVLVLLVIAWAAYTYLPHPIGLLVAVVCGVLVLVVLVGAVDDGRLTDTR